ncbi:MAG: hypothetical protein HQ548_03000 [Chloroflexi bacterium]|nr:hypothetical protein [Chloroflexota bacterium]
MDATTLLDKLAALGIAAILEDGKLYLQPGDKVPPELMDEARAHKAALVTALSNRRVPPETGLAALLERLRDGQAWLTANLDRHMATEPCGDPVFVSSLVAWDCVERLLRRLYGFSACICESGACDLGSPVLCTTCAEAWDREVTT